MRKFVIFSSGVIFTEKLFLMVLKVSTEQRIDFRIYQEERKNTIQEICTKRYNFAPGAANQIFLTHPVCKKI